jgi:hypothetical protein
MNVDDGFERNLSGWLHEEAEHRVPDHLADVLALTSTTRQRPSWSRLERWLPMQQTLRITPVPRPVWLLVVLALLVAIGTVALVAGSRPHPAPPFGDARNGPVAFARDGDLLTIDPATGRTQTLLTGPELDGAPYFSRDGLSLFFLRESADGGASVVVANADGTNVHVITDPLEDQTWVDWSFDSRRLALISRIEGVQRLTIAAVDGSSVETPELPVAADMASWRGPAGDDVVFRGSPLNRSTQHGLYAVRPDGTDLRALTPLGSGDGAYLSPTVSPDGSAVLYASFDTTDGRSPDGGSPDIEWDGKLIRLHMLDLVTGTDRPIQPLADPTDHTLPMSFLQGIYSADGDRIAFIAGRNDGSHQLYVALADGTGAKPVGKVWQSSGPVHFEFSADGRSLLVGLPYEPSAFLLPIDGGEGTTLPWDGVDLPSMQRLAP